ncbi:MAG: glycosyl transferase [Bacteroidetes bacterium GWF2_42_66]|nr:MAG: glycosyl transferase [Bacteroidetes bacterium GWA2_42_15]OFX96266.1 MAG: glycosyl transferase [Bacteroidetes bacterium GWE2_42_39]OFY46305.1 MAG: glycosyl transferase [Bacteroidetes bacterium GWF2_42_66]HBL78313.1 glycosyl transferase [Prolixibacteraceae bacterium]HCU60081.1 glycosyl transferase [Prolixibacteraceae bacterium]
MKILYAIQGTGNGHVARATEIVPLLKKMTDTDVLISGIQSDLGLPFEVNYCFYGLSFIFGKRGGVDIAQTIRKSNFGRLLVDIRSVPVEKYDLVINDFEPVSAWACKIKRKPCIGLSHQNAVLHPGVPKPLKRDRFGEFILKNYAPVSEKYGFHFQPVGEHIFTPVIRRRIRNSKVGNKGHFTVYLPAYSDEEIIRVLGAVKDVQWEVFSKHAKGTYGYGNVYIQKVSIEEFGKSFLSCDGILCTAGFETPAEALYLGKKLCVIPMKNQYEQLCNAAFLASMGIKVLPSLSGNEAKIEEWAKTSEYLHINYPDQTEAILKNILEQYERN